MLQGGNSESAQKLDIADASSLGDLLGHVGCWSVRRKEGLGLIFVNSETGRAQAEPPEDVLAELGMEDGQNPSCPSSDPASRSGTASGSGSARTAEEFTASGPLQLRKTLDASGSDPQFSRILLGNNRGMPLAMARDILAAVREDVSIFEGARKSFSDVPHEQAVFSLDTMPAELEEVALALGPGEFSGVIGTEAGMQILLRVC